MKNIRHQQQWNVVVHYPFGNYHYESIGYNIKIATLEKDTSRIMVDAKMTWLKI